MHFYMYYITANDSIHVHHVIFQLGISKGLTSPADVSMAHFLKFYVESFHQQLSCLYCLCWDKWL